MPLLKLWNTIRGRSAAAAPAPDQPSPVDQQSAARKPVQVTQSSRRRSGKGSGRTLFGGPHGSLRKLIKSIPARSVVEICVGDGSRAAAVVQALRNTDEVKYVAIDQFELGSGELTLKQYHQRLRTAGIRAQVIPNAIEGGLIQVARTVGQVDLVIIAADRKCWQEPATLAKLARICHNQTVVLYQEPDEIWHLHENPTTTGRQAA